MVVPFEPSSGVIVTRDFESPWSFTEKLFYPPLLLYSVNSQFTEEQWRITILLYSHDKNTRGDSSRPSLGSRSNSFIFLPKIYDLHGSLLQASTRLIIQNPCID